MITAGVYLRFNRYFAFMFGPNKNDTAHGVVRFGGHIENNETPEECVIREVVEEANVKVSLLNSPKTFYMNNEEAIPELIARGTLKKIQPILYSSGTLSKPLSVTYIGSTTDILQPSGETNGIILLNVEEIRRICKHSITLQQFLESKGKIFEKNKLNRKHHLVPFLQLRFLEWAIKHGHIKV